jgi:hypothetical protein
MIATGEDGVKVDEAGGFGDLLEGNWAPRVTRSRKRGQRG